ncbi:MAG: YbaK/EbsC family protein [Chloroflexota bacterium]|jgi:prolyl-tRNA editing enzyme YbaK/EbsC (Cys-tRNA(Pro) deacylase)
MSELNQPPVSLALDALDVPHRVFVHDGPVTSLEQAAEERDQQPEQVIRSIVFRLSKGDYLMVLMAGPDQISWSALRNYLGLSRLTTASREEVLQVTSYKLGAVAPFGLPKPMRILVDESVLSQEEISLGSGVRGTAVIMQSADLLPALGGAEVGRFGESKG